MEVNSTRKAPVDGEDRSREQSHPNHDSHYEHHGAGHHHTHHEEAMSPEEAMQSLLLLGQVAFSAGDYESAADAWGSALHLGQNEVALYNLASLHARGLGVRRDFVEAARLFHQAELLGNDRAGKLCRKCLFDYVCEGLEAKGPADVYAEVAVFVSSVYPEAADKRREVTNGLLAIANTLSSRGEDAAAEKVLRAAAEFGGDE